MKTVQECNIFAFFVQADVSRLTKIAEKEDVKGDMGLAHNLSLPFLGLGKSRKQQYSQPCSRFEDNFHEAVSKCTTDHSPFTFRQADCP